MNPVLKGLSVQRGCHACSLSGTECCRHLAPFCRSEEPSAGTSCCTPRKTLEVVSGRNSSSSASLVDMTAVAFSSSSACGTVVDSHGCGDVYKPRSLEDQVEYLLATITRPDMFTSLGVRVTSEPARWGAQRKLGCLALQFRNFFFFFFKRFYLFER